MNCNQLSATENMSGIKDRVKYSRLDFLFTCVGLPLFLLDIGLDIWAAVTFYQEKAYVCLGILLLLLVGSSLLAQVYSWLWYSYDKFKMKTKVEGWPSQGQLKLLHVFQLGVYLRHAGVLEMAVKNFRKKCCDPEKGARAPAVGGQHTDPEPDLDPELSAAFLSQDLGILRLIETFSEGAPQLILMLTLILQEGHLDSVTVLKAVSSASAISFCVTSYHRSLRAFLPEKEKQNIISSIVYFIWNLLLISSRLVAIALFASVLPCFIFTHFVCSWLVLFFFVWQSNTDFMESSFGEWLYRATVALIWYFDWFNVVEGKTRNRTLLYHGYILADISILCGVWWWRMSTNPPDFVIQPLHALITAVCVVAVYILGLLLKVIYYECLHPNKQRVPDATDCGSASPPAAALATAQTPARYSERMRKLAKNFYS